MSLKVINYREVGINKIEVKANKKYKLCEKIG